MKVPKRILTILEGESLVNDASSLIVFKFALVAVISGTFSMQEATGQFFVVSIMGIVIGLAGAHIMYAIHRFLPTTSAIDAVLSLMTPYILFLAAEEFHFSGVMAVVSGGLFISYRSHEIFKTGSTRLNMLGVWTTVIFVMNALVFILIGLELPEIIHGLGDYSIADGIEYGIIISIITIILRFLWVYPIAHIPRWLSAKARKDPSPGWKGPLVIGWAGMRGVVSLATALSIPIMLTDDVDFPQRNLIIFITFVVIFITLVLQGLTLPFVIKLIKIEEMDAIGSEEEQQAGIKLRLHSIALNLLISKHNNNGNELINIFKANLEKEINNTQMKLTSLELCVNTTEDLKVYHHTLLEIYSLQRKELFQLRREKFYSDEEIRKAELQLDLDELKISGHNH